MADYKQDRYTWKPGDVKSYKSLDEAKKAIEKEGGRFIPVSQMQKKSKKK